MTHAVDLTLTDLVCRVDADNPDLDPRALAWRVAMETPEANLIDFYIEALDLMIAYPGGELS